MTLPHDEGADDPWRDHRLRAPPPALAEKTGERLNAIDMRLVKIETRMEEGCKSFATKADLAEAKNSIVMWVVSTVLLAQLLPAVLQKFGL